MEKLIFTGDAGEQILLYVLETTKLGGVDYILASDVETGDGNCYILKDVSAPEDEAAVYVMVEDDQELENLLALFSELLEDVDLEL